MSRLAPDDKQILPRPIKLAALKRLSVKENACTLCFDNIANIQLLPCNHKYIPHYFIVVTPTLPQFNFNSIINVVGSFWNSALTPPPPQPTQNL